MFNAQRPTAASLLFMRPVRAPDAQWACDGSTRVGGGGGSAASLAASAAVETWVGVLSALHDAHWSALCV